MTQQELPPRVVTYPGYPAYPAYPGSGSAFVDQRQLPPPSTTLATWALVLGVIPIPLANIVSIGQAITVLRRCRDGRNHGKGQAIAALVIAPLWLVLVLGVLAAQLAAGPERNAAGVVMTKGDIVVSSLQVGDCLASDVAEGAVTQTVEVGPCSKAHVAEVFARFSLDEGTFPGREAVLRLAQGGCVKRFADFAASNQGLVSPRVNYYYPAEKSWARNRSVVCLVASGSNTA